MIVDSHVSLITSTADIMRTKSRQAFRTRRFGTRTEFVRLMDEVGLRSLLFLLTLARSLRI